MTKFSKVSMKVSCQIFLPPYVWSRRVKTLGAASMQTVFWQWVWRPSCLQPALCARAHSHEGVFAAFREHWETIFRCGVNWPKQPKSRANYRTQHVRHTTHPTPTFFIINKKTECRRLAKGRLRSLYSIAVHHEQRNKRWSDSWHDAGRHCDILKQKWRARPCTH